MDYLNRCLFCLEAIPNNMSECPHCGKRGIPKVKHSDALVPGTILAARYLIGEVTERSSYLIRYIAFDCVDNEKVYVDEFFPQSMASRKPGELKLEIDPNSMMLAERAKKAWLSTDAKAAFQENMTVYIVFAEALERTPDEERTVMQTKSAFEKPEIKRMPRKATGVVLLCAGILLTALGTKILFTPPEPIDDSVQEELQTAETSEQTEEPILNEESNIENSIENENDIENSENTQEGFEQEMPAEAVEEPIQEENDAESELPEAENANPVQDENPADGNIDMPSEDTLPEDIPESTPDSKQ